MIRITVFLVVLIASRSACADLQIKTHGETGKKHASYLSMERRLYSRAKTLLRHLSLIHATASGTSRAALAFETTNDSNGSLTLSGAHVDGLQIQDAYRNLAPNLIERTVTVTANSGHALLPRLRLACGRGRILFTHSLARKRNPSVLQSRLYRSRIRRRFSSDLSLSRLPFGRHSLWHHRRHSRSLGKPVLHGF